MTFEDAYALAREIRTSHRHCLLLVAVGRFIPPEQMDRTPERWGVSVILPDGKRAVLWSRAELLELSPPPVKPRTIEELGVPLLF